MPLASHKCDSESILDPDYDLLCLGVGWYIITGMLYEMVEDCVQPNAQERASVQGKCLWT